MSAGVTYTSPTGCTRSPDAWKLLGVHDLHLLAVKMRTSKAGNRDKMVRQLAVGSTNQTIGCCRVCTYIRLCRAQK